MVLLLIETSLLLARMGLLPFFKIFSQTDESEKMAGRIVHVEKDLRRRGVNSLVWESYGDSEPVFYHDSVLTLEQSAATLALYNNTQVHLNENTLVTIEPNDKNHSGEIRLRFHRGGIRAQTADKDANVAAEDWYADIKPGSDVDMRRMGGVDEVFVRKGQVGWQERRHTNFWGQ